MSQARRLKIVVYSRGTCCLCHDAERMLRDRQPQFGFELQVIDIDGEPSLRERYDDCVPVVTFDGKERFRGRISAALLERQLRSESL